MEADVSPGEEGTVPVESQLISFESKRIAFEDEWLEESKDRFDAYKKGLIQSVDGGEAVAAIRAALGR